MFYTFLHISTLLEFDFKIFKSRFRVKLNAIITIFEYLLYI